MKKGLLLSIAALLTFSLSLAGCGGASNSAGGATEGGSAPSGNGGENLVLKIGDITKPNHSWNRALEKLNQDLQSKSNGRISLELYPGGELGNEKDMMQQLDTGNLDMAVITAAELSSHSDAFGAWLMPFVVDNHEQAYKLWSSQESMALFETLGKNNAHGLGYLSSGFRYYLMKSAPITQPADLASKKLRVTPSPTILDYYKSLQVSPTPMPLTEVYTALQTGVIDGIDIDSESVQPEKLYEIAKEMTPSKHMYWIGGILINKDRWSGLSDEDKKLLEESITAAMEFNVQDVSKNETEGLEFLKQQPDFTISELKKEDFAPYVEGVESAWSTKSPEIAAFLKKAKEISNQ